ncbi:MAG TPA: DUF6152 family protein [Steroidobacteraceae bacterium]|nr:DUF6152 family protein [Steroidobacteraceae bacterium]
MLGSARTRLLISSALLGVARFASAHHSVAGEFDVHKMVRLNGVVSKVDWANPHIYVHVSVKDDHGGITEWRLESVPVAMMRKAGLSKEMLLGHGQPATVEVYPARDGTPHLGFMVKITYVDGHHYQFAPDSPATAAR